MATVKSGINKVGNNYYQSITMDNEDGGVGTTLYRVNADGSGGVPIYDVDKPAGSTSLSKSFDPNATAEEKRLLSDPNSQLSQVRAQQVTSSNPYRDPTPVQNSTLAQAGGRSGNTASVAGSPDAQGGSTPTSPQQQSQQPSSGALVYPNDLASTDQDRIMFHAHEYKSGSRLGGTIFDFELNPVQYIPLEQRIYLPIQASISDQNSVGWEPDTLNPIEIAAAKYSNNLIISATKDIGTVAASGVGGALNLIKNDPRLQESIKNYIIGQAIGVNNLNSRLQGQILNPNLELLFQGPQLRPFNFSFKLSPRSENEAKTVKSIINYFKKNMSVKKTSDNIFLKTPNVFKIEYQHKKAKHPGINNIKMCALTNCSVDYTPLGTYMTYPEGTMVSYTMSLQFQELTPIYDTDYKDTSQIEF